MCAHSRDSPAGWDDIQGPQELLPLQCGPCLHQCAVVSGDACCEHLDQHHHGEARESLQARHQMLHDVQPDHRLCPSKAKSRKLRDTCQRSHILNKLLIWLVVFVSTICDITMYTIKHTHNTYAKTSFVGTEVNYTVNRPVLLPPENSTLSAVTMHQRSIKFC